MDPISKAVRSVLDSLERGDAPDPDLQEVLKAISVSSETFMNPKAFPNLMRLTATHKRCQRFNELWMAQRKQTEAHEVFLIPVQLLSDDLAELLARYQLHQADCLVEGLFGFYTLGVCKWKEEGDKTGAKDGGRDGQGDGNSFIPKGRGGRLCG